MQQRLETLKEWYSTSQGVKNLKKFIVENDYYDRTFEPRSRYQIERYETWRCSFIFLGLGGGLFGALNGFRLGKEQFKQVSQLSIYGSRYEAARTQQFYHVIGAMGYGVPILIRCSMAATFLFGVPGLFGVYHNDTDYLSSFVISGGVCGGIMSLIQRKEFRTFSQKLLLTAAGCVFSIPYGVYCLVQQKCKIYPMYEVYKWRWKRIDPLWERYHSPTDNTSQTDNTSPTDNTSLTDVIPPENKADND